MSKHTPGPWRYAPVGEYGAMVHFGVNNGGFHLHKETPNGTANARLMATSPRLLAALKALVEQSECSINNVPIWNEARAAILEAEGQP